MGHRLGSRQSGRWGVKWTVTGPEIETTSQLTAQLADFFTWGTAFRSASLCLDGLLQQQNHRDMAAQRQGTLCRSHLPSVPQSHWFMGPLRFRAAVVVCHCQSGCSVPGPLLLSGSLAHRSMVSDERGSWHRRIDRRIAERWGIAPARIVSNSRRPARCAGPTSTLAAVSTESSAACNEFAGLGSPSPDEDNRKSSASCHRRRRRRPSATAPGRTGLRTACPRPALARQWTRLSKRDGQRARRQAGAACLPPRLRAGRSAGHPTLRLAAQQREPATRRWCPPARRGRAPRT